MVQKRISYFSISVVFIVFIISLPGVFESLPDTSDTDCQFVVCVIKLQPLFAVMKVIPVFGCFGASITLAVLIKYKLHLTNKFNTKISKTVIKIIFITTATEMVPLLASGIFMAITHNSLILYIGSLPFALSTLAVAISAKIYYNLFKKVINKQATSSPQIFN